MRYHGNYCGPNWSAGKVQESVIDDSVPAIDELDECCLHHDAAYYRGDDLAEADTEFAKCAVTTGAKGSAAAIIVGAQGLFRMASKLRGSKKSASKQKVAAPKAVTQPAAVARGTRISGASPKVTTLRDGVVVQHRSLLGTVKNTTSFAVTTYPTNPGMATSFPWLCKLASRFEKYRFKRLRFEFRSVCSTSEAGVVMLSYDYDALDSAPTTKSDQSQSAPNTEANAWMNNRLDVRPDTQWRFTRQGPVTGDLKTYDLGYVAVSTSYGGGTNTVGEIYVDYEVELTIPSVGRECLYNFIGTSGFTTGNIFNSGIEGGYNAPCYKADGKTLKFTVPGDYMVMISLQCNAAASISTWSGITVTGNQTKAIMDVGGNAQSKAASWAIRVEAGATLIFDTAFTAANAQRAVCTVTPCDFESAIAY